MVEDEQLPPVKDRLKGLKERELVVLKALMKAVEYNRLSTVGIKDLLPDLTVSQVVRVLKKLEKHRLVGSEKLGRHRVWGIINRATYEKLIDLWHKSRV